MERVAQAWRKDHVVRPYALGLSGTHWLAQDDCGMRMNSRMKRAKNADRTTVAIGSGLGIEHLREDIIMYSASVSSLGSSM